MSQKCVHESLLLISSSRYACVVVLWGQGPKVVSNLYLRPSLCVCVRESVLGIFFINSEDFRIIMFQGHFPTKRVIQC